MTLRSRPVSRLLLAPGLALGLICACLGPSFAQATPAVQPAQVLVVDQARLFAESLYGRRVGAALEALSTDLASENRRIEEELTREEQALTEARPTLAPADFRAKADAFDAKVERIRTEQADKIARIDALRQAEEERFSRTIPDVMTEILREKGAVLLLDRRAVLLSAEAIDITDLAVARIDAAIADGAGLPPLPTAP